MFMYLGHSVTLTHTGYTTCGGYRLHVIESSKIY